MGEIPLEFQRFGLSPKTGFLHENGPLRRLPEKYARWEELMDHLPKLTASNEIRDRIESVF
jgi:hypothetical protein